MESTNKTKSSMKRFFNLFSIIAALVFTTSPLWLNYVAAIPMNNFSGAIYTSTVDGITVNQNRYASKADVYLNGGPQNQMGNGLPNGTYYFQVTNPNGALLLSSDPARCRQLTVMNGRVSGAAGPCPHPNGDYNPANGSTSVQLFPFNDTPNNGDEYKAWLIRQTSETSIVGDPMTSAVLQFANKDTKTDNFKVGEQPPPTPTPCAPDDPSCAPPPTVTLSGHKFYDANANGIDNSEAPVANIKIQIFLNGSTTPIIRTTDGNGDWTLTGVIVNSTYSVNEAPLPCVDDNNDMVCDAGKYWVQTAPVPDSVGFQGYSGTATMNVTGLNFGDICFGPARGGLTLGFWSNKNGQAIIKSNDNFVGDFTFLNGLNLKNYNGSNFDINPVTGGVTAYTNQFRTWLLNGNAVNMAYMLSVQLSATSLDVRHGFLNDGQIVDATSLGLGYVSIGSVRNSANTELNAPGGSTTFTGNPLRDDEEILKNFLDGVNNNRLPFGSATPCSVFYPPPPTPTPTP